MTQKYFNFILLIWDSIWTCINDTLLKREDTQELIKRVNQMDSVNLDSLYEQTMARFDQLFPPSTSRRSYGRDTGHQSHSTTTQQCNLCKKSIKTNTLIKHSIVPYDISKKLGLESIKAVDLCFKCHRAIHKWNTRKVSWVIHDKTNRSRAKPLTDVAQEYVSAYQALYQRKLPRAQSTKELAPQGASV